MAIVFQTSFEVNLALNRLHGLVVPCHRAAAASLMGQSCMLFEIEGTITASRRFGECAQAHASNGNTLETRGQWETEDCEEKVSDAVSKKENDL